MEEWKLVYFEPEYEVSNTGKIRNIKTGHIKSQRYDRYGYKRVTLYPSGITYTIHRIVARIWISNPYNFPEINHLDGDKTNNNVSNLEWCTISMNSHHRDTVLQSKWTGALNPGHKLSIEEAKDIKYNNPTLDNASLGDIYGVSAECIRRIRVGDRWKHI